MADIIGVLGEATTGTVATHTAYTVPAGKAARCKIMMYGQANAAGSALTLLVNGIPVAAATIVASEYIWTSTDNMVEMNATAPGGATTDATVGLSPQEYYLSAGDTVQYTVATNAMISVNVQVHGAEVDVT